MELKLIIFLVLWTSLCAQTVKVDMGTCTCNCASGMDSTLTSHFIDGVGNGKFLQSIRGLKGEMGRPGDVGLPGIAGILGEQGQPGPPAADISKEQDSSIIDSCNDLQDGESSGIYKIKPPGSSKAMQVFCETSAAGGGWTLVASIHENNIYGKCTAGDNWSSDQGIFQGNNITSLNNWENFKTFGHPEAATSSDYKSAAYYSLPGDDVMVWHVPNDSNMSAWDLAATLKYYTNNRFLSDYGGTLQALYSKYFPLRQQTERDPNSAVEDIANTMEQTSSSIRLLIPNFYSYSYDGSGDRYISDGGSDMYDTGNKVYYQIGNSPYTQITYGQKYLDFGSGTQVYSRKSHPFITYMWIANNDRNVGTFSLKVTSGTGADSGGHYSSDSGVVTSGNFSCKYHAYHVYSASSDPSICEVYFYCFSEELWNSVPANTFTRTFWSSSTDNLNNGVSLHGDPSSVLLGYTLLSRRSAVRITNDQVRAVLSRMITVFQTVTNFPGIDCARVNDSLAVPIQYIEGDDDVIMNDIPPTQKPHVQAGYVHFRPLDIGGKPNAFCPGIKSLSCNPSYVCVGGIGVDGSESAERKRACGDFAGWQGEPFDNATATVPSGSARPLDNLKTTLLIFTR